MRLLTWGFFTLECKYALRENEASHVDWDAIVSKDETAFGNGEDAVGIDKLALGDWEGALNKDKVSLNDWEGAFSKDKLAFSDWEDAFSKDKLALGDWEYALSKDDVSKKENILGENVGVGKDNIGVLRWFGESIVMDGVLGQSGGSRQSSICPKSSNDGSKGPNDGSTGPNDGSKGPKDGSKGPNDGSKGLHNEPLSSSIYLVWKVVCFGTTMDYKDNNEL